jgi:hypothetical protein
MRVVVAREAGVPDELPNARPQLKHLSALAALGNLHRLQKTFVFSPPGALTQRTNVT